MISIIYIYILLDTHTNWPDIGEEWNLFTSNRAKLQREFRINLVKTWHPHYWPQNSLTRSSTKKHR